MARRALRLWACAALAALALSAVAVARAWPQSAGDAAALERIALVHGLLPRVAVSLLCGAMLGLSGLLMQRSLRNPLAEPSTLGVAAGAQFALALATLHAPALVANGREGVALAGGLAAAFLVLAVNWRRGLEPVAVVLTGLMVSLVASAGSAALILADGDYLYSLFLWGGGSLVQGSWGPALGLLWRFALGLGAGALLLRPLGALGVGDSGARALGLNVGAVRCLALALAVWLASAVTASVGVIGFVGLAAPALAGLSGARSLRARVVAAPLLGALLLWLADGLVLLFATANTERVPTGAATALLGGPLLLWLLPRLRMMEWPSLTARATPSRRLSRAPLALAALLAGALLLAALSLGLGQGPDGWSLAQGALLADLLPWRLPHVLVAASAGAMLAAAGFLLQRVTANPLAGPEILGVGAGAGLGLTLVLLLVPAPGLFLRVAASALAAVLALLLLLGVAARGRFGPERLLLGGAAVGAFASATTTAVIATGSQTAFDLLGWLSGSINGTTLSQALALAGAAALLLAPLPLARRWLLLLPLGASSASALGAPVRRAQGALVLWAGVLTALAALFVGPLSFVGLLAPHLARALGFGRLALPAACAAGAALLVLSDWLARNAAFPYQLPLGLFATLVGGPVLVWMLAGGARRASSS